MLFGVGVSCLVLYSIVSCLCKNCSGSITSAGEERELICLLWFTCNCVVSVRRGFLFLLILGMGCVILLWHSLVLPYFERMDTCTIVRTNNGSSLYYKLTFIEFGSCYLHYATMTSRKLQASLDYTIKSPFANTCNM